MRCACNSRRRRRLFWVQKKGKMRTLRHVGCARKKPELHQLQPIERPFSSSLVVSCCCSGKNSKNKTCSRSPKNDDDDVLLTLEHALELVWGRLHDASHHCGIDASGYKSCLSCWLGGTCYSIGDLDLLRCGPFCSARWLFALCWLVVCRARGEKQAEKQPRHEISGTNSETDPLASGANTTTSSS